MKAKTWVEMHNGEILSEIPFVLWISEGEDRERRHEFKAPNPPIHHGDPNLYSRLSYEWIKDVCKDLGYSIDHIIRGECSESGVRDCYVYRNRDKVPFAVIRPAVFVKD